MISLGDAAIIYQKTINLFRTDLRTIKIKLSLIKWDTLTVCAQKRSKPLQQVQ